MVHLVGNPLSNSGGSGFKDKKRANKSRGVWAQVVEAVGGMGTLVPPKEKSEGAKPHLCGLVESCSAYTPSLVQR